MALEKFLIAPFNTGLQTDLRPWLIMDDAFQELINAYVFRGRIRKRFGGRLMGSSSTPAVAPLLSRLRVQVGTIETPSALSGTAFNLGQQFSAGGQIFTVWQTGTPASMLATGPGTGTFDTTSGAFVLSSTGLGNSTPIYWYPALPVMGLTTYDQANTTINNQPPFAFDTQFAYSYSNGWYQSGTTVWQGDNTNFFWTCNWVGATDDARFLFVTNFNADVGTPLTTYDPIYYYDGSTWTNFSPLTVFKTDGSFVASCKIIVAFKNVLILLNTIETIAPSGANTNAAFPQRARYSLRGSPIATETSGGGPAPYAWLEPNQTYTVSGAKGIAAGAGYLDASTDEQIIGAEFVKDRLIVFFERSTWELVWTGNYATPFYWQRLNTELGAEAQNATVPFDKFVLTVGNTGVHSCNGSNVERIDNKIPAQIFEARSENGASNRICGIRDYYTEMVYWAYVDRDLNPIQTYPNKILAYNYKNDSWAVFEDSITAFGYWEQSQDLTWQSSTTTWQASDFTWTDNIEEPMSRQIIAGNAQGYVFLVDPDTNRNAPVMQITNMKYNTLADQDNNLLTLTIYDHTLTVDEDSEYTFFGNYILIENAQGITFPSQNTIFPVNSIVDANTITISAVITGTYTGGGTATRVSNISILSKQWNPYTKDGRDINLSRIEFLVTKTTAGEITVDYYPSSTELSMIQQGGPTGTNSIVGNNILETYPDPLFPLEAVQTRLWKTVYFLGGGQSIQISMYMSDAEMTDPAISLSGFEMDAILLYIRPTTSRMN